MAFISFKPVSSMFEFTEKDVSTPAKSTRSSTIDTTAGDDSYFSQDEGGFSSTDAGDDIEATYADLDDLASTSSDGEDTAPQPLPKASAPTCIYSVMMLLRFATVCGDDDDDSAMPARYSACSESELPAAQPKPPSKEGVVRPWRTSSADAADSWRAPQMALPAVSEDSWLAKQRNRDASGTPDEDANMVRAARSILNKLTIEKFDSLFEQLTMCGIKRPHHISLLMREVFEKATTQHHFIPMYAELCIQLEKDPRILAVVENTDQSQSFRRLLLNQCQQVFEQVLEPPANDSDADEEMLFCRKQRALGNMKLIGHLLTHGMLSPNLFVECCDEMMRKREQCPEALEALVALVMVAGPKFDYSAWPFYGRLGQVFADMGALTKDKSVAPRMRFLIRDVLDARVAGWPSCAVVPCKLVEVREATAVSPHVQQTVSAIDCCLAALGGVDSPSNAKKQSFKFSTEAAIFTPASSPKAETAPAIAAEEEPFNVVTFRKAFASILSDLASDKNIPAAVQRIRLQQVPVASQAEQFADILTRVVEERCGAVRRCELAFLVGLARGESSAFDRKECLAGIRLFFKDIYGGLCDEVHRLPAIMKSEFVPTVLTVLSAEELNPVVPSGMRK